MFYIIGGNRFPSLKNDHSFTFFVLPKDNHKALLNIGC